MFEPLPMDVLDAKNELELVLVERYGQEAAEAMMVLTVYYKVLCIKSIEAAGDALMHFRQCYEDHLENSSTGKKQH